MSWPPAWLAVSLLALVPVQGAQAESEPGVALVGGSDEARTIELRVVGKGAAATLEGDLRLALQATRASKRAAIRLRYAPDGDEGITKVVADSGVVVFSDGRPHENRFHLKPRRLRRMLLHAVLPASEPANALDGTLFIETFHPGDDQPSERISLQVTAAIRSHSNVVFEPKSVTLQATRACALDLPCPSHTSQEVRLVGPGVAHLASDLAAARRREMSATFHNGSGDAATVILSGIAPSATDAGALDASIKIDGEPEPGSYKGTLGLSEIMPTAPTLAVDVHSRVWVVWAVALVAVGVIAAAILLVHVELSGRKRRLHKALRGAVDNYRRTRSENEPEPGRHLVWTMDSVITGPLAPDPTWTYYDDVSTANRIATANRWARNDVDLDEVQNAVLDLLVAVKRWLLALTTVNDLRAVTEAEPEDRPDHPWRDTTVFRDTELICRAARRTPPDEQTRLKLIDDAQRQGTWHRCCARVWEVKRELALDQDADVRARAAEVKLDDFLAEITPVSLRTAQQWDLLEQGLDELYRRLQRAKPGSNYPPLVWQPFADVTKLREDLDTLEERRRSPEPVTSTIGLNRALGDTRAATRSWRDRVRELIARIRSSLDPRSLLARLRARDYAVTLLIILISSIVYVLGVYDDSWGSAFDYATAITAGFAGQVVAKWAALPLYRSIRLRTAAASKEASPASA